MKKPDNYRLRMIHTQWYLILYKGTTEVERLGPFTYKEALQEAENLNLRDGDRG